MIPGVLCSEGLMFDWCLVYEDTRANEVVSPRRMLRRKASSKMGVVSSPEDTTDRHVNFADAT